MSLTLAEKRQLLQLARAALTAALRQQPAPAIDAAALPPALQRPGACFVTLTNHGELRGCIGSLEARQPLYADACEHAVQAALEDYRFPSVTITELAKIEFEISVLTDPQPLEYAAPADLPGRLRPNIDGVVLQQGYRRATFLPQVWEHFADAETFLAQLCQKMGAAPDAWQKTKLEVLTYQVEKFTEAEIAAG